jgi:TonB family protein
VGSLVAGFHPVVWMLKSQIAQTREMVCDDMATEELIDRPAYTQSLLRLASMISVSPRVLHSHAIGIFDANILEKRVMTMKTKKQPLSVAVRYGLIIPGALLLSSVAAGGAAMAVSIETQANSQAATDGEPYGHVYRLGKGSDVIAPKLISSKLPEFPASAKGSNDKFEGNCVVALIVDATGTPRDVRVIRPLRTDFDANAIDAVKQYRFAPGERQGEPVAVALKVEVNFKRF